MSGHTPAPWEVGNQHYKDQTVSIDAPAGNKAHGYVSWEGMVVCFGDEDRPAQGILTATANARHIVKCVNYHDRLVKALDDLQLVAACIDYDAIEPKLKRARDILAELGQQ